MQLKEKQKDLSLNRIDKKIIAVEKENNIPILKHIFLLQRPKHFDVCNNEGSHNWFLLFTLRKS